jgi:hypothetical protein
MRDNHFLLKTEKRPRPTIDALIKIGLVALAGYVCVLSVVAYVYGG